MVCCIRGFVLCCLRFFAMRPSVVGIAQSCLFAFVLFVALKVAASELVLFVLPPSFCCGSRCAACVVVSLCVCSLCVAFVFTDAVAGRLLLCFAVAVGGCFFVAAVFKP